MSKQLARTLAALTLVMFLALSGCSAGAAHDGTTANTASGTTDQDTGNAPVGSQTGIPAEGEPLANGTPVMYEFYSDT